MLAALLGKELTEEDNALLQAEEKDPLMKGQVPSSIFTEQNDRAQQEQHSDAGYSQEQAESVR